MKKAKIILSVLFFCISIFCVQNCLAKEKPVGKVTAPDGTKYNLTNYVEGANILRGCPPWSEKYAEMRGCVLCSMFEVILKTDQNMASMSYKALAHDFRNVIIIVLALFIAYQTLLSVSALTKQDVGKYLQTILIQAFKVMVAALLLTNSSYIYKSNPLMLVLTGHIRSIRLASTTRPCILYKMYWRMTYYLLM